MKKEKTLKERKSEILLEVFDEISKDGIFTDYHMTNLSIKLDELHKQTFKEILDEIDKIPYSTETAEVRSKEIKQIIKQKSGFEELK